MIDKLKQLFFYEKTFYITIIGTLVLLPVNTFFYFFIQEIALLPFCLFFAGFALSIGVLTAYIRGDLINLNGLVVALIMYLFFRYGLSVEYLMSYDSETILNYGLAGCLIISSGIMAFCIIIIMAINHFSMNTSVGNNQTKIVVNQLLTIVLFFVMASLIIEYIIVGGSIQNTVIYCLGFFCDMLLVCAVACCEMRLAVDRTDNKMNRGSEKDVKLAVWYLIAFLLCIFGITMLLLTKDYSVFFYIACIMAGIFCLTGLIFHLHNYNKNNKKWIKIGTKCLFVCSLSSLFLAAFCFLLMLSQFHQPIKVDAAGEISDINMKDVMSAENAYVYQTDGLYIIFPQYEKVEFTFGSRPSTSEEDITFCGGCAFADKYELGFSYSNIVGDYVKNGKYYNGAKLPDEGFGAFAFFNGKGHFGTYEESEKLLNDAAEAGGYGFRQYSVVSNHQAIFIGGDEYRIYRALTEINGRVCIVECSKMMYLRDFISSVQKLGVKDALYMEMGAGWNYSWYRDESGKSVNLFGISFPFSHNWVVFKK